MLDRLWGHFQKKQKRPDVFAGLSFDEMRKMFRFGRFRGFFTICGIHLPEYISEHHPEAKKLLDVAGDSFDRMIRLLDDDGRPFKTPVDEFESSLKDLSTRIDAEDMWQTLKLRCQEMRRFLRIPKQESAERRAAYEVVVATHDGDLRARHQKLLESLPTLRRLDEIVQQTDPEDKRNFGHGAWTGIGFVPDFLTPYSHERYDDMPTNCEYFANDANGTRFFGLLKLDGKVREDSPVLYYGSGGCGCNLVAKDLRDFLALGKRAGFFSVQFSIDEKERLGQAEKELMELLGRELVLPRYETVVERIPEVEKQYERELKFACYNS